MATHRFPELVQAPLPPELQQMQATLELLEGPQAGEVRAIWQGVLSGIRRRRQLLSAVQEALAQLRLDIKALEFDLLATRQERDALRQQLGESE